MTPPVKGKPTFDDLRKHAEDQLKAAGANPEPALDDLGRLFHELDIHRTELEMQNEELLRAKQEADESRDRYADLYENAPVGYVTLTDKGLIVRINAAAKKTLGLGESNGVKTAFVRHVQRDHQGRFHGLLNTRNGMRSGETVLKRKDGTFFPALLEVTDEKAEGGGPAGWRLAFMDISRQKEAENLLLAEQHAKELTEANAKLNEANAKLTLEMEERRRAEKQIKEYAEKLEQRNNELQEFAFVASHDLQEPLRKVSTFTELVRDGYSRVLDEKGLDYLERARNAAMRMQVLIRALLDYSRLSTRKVESKPIDLREIVKGVIEDLQVSIESAGAKVEVEVSEFCTITAEPTHLRQLLQNLISNGLKFQSRTDPVVKVSGSLLEKNAADNPLGAPACRISVEDNGIGFEEKYLDRIWTPFQRLHGRSEYEGTGMGLAICRKIVEQHGGRITARSEKGKGSTFIVTLPVGE